MAKCQRIGRPVVRTLIESPDDFDYCVQMAHQEVKEELENSYLQDSRTYAARKHRSCHKRDIPMSDQERKEESKRNSRNYTKRNREEIAFCRAKLSSEKMLLEKKCQLANVLFGTKLENEVKDTLEMAKTIMRNILGEGGIGNYLVEDIFEMYEQKKKSVHNMVWTKADYSFEEEYNELKQEYEDLMKSKYDYIIEKSRTNFASAKSRLYQKVLRAELKRECYVLHCALKNIEQKIENLQACDNELKTTIWFKFLQPIDEYFEMSTTYDKNGEDYTTWQKIGEFYKDQRKTGGAPQDLNKIVEKPLEVVKKVNVNNKKEKEENYSADSQIMKAAVNMDSDWTAKRLPWDELVGDHVPEADNEVTISTSPPPTKLIKLEASSAQGEQSKNLLTISNRADNTSFKVSEDTPLRDVLAIARKRKNPQ